MRDPISLLDGITGSTRRKVEPSDIGLYYYKFWSEVLPKLRELGFVTGRQETPSRSFLNINAKKAGYTYYMAFTKEHTFRVELYIDKGDAKSNKSRFDSLHSMKDEIEKQMGTPLSWQRLDKKRACRIAVQRDVYDRDSQRDELMKWGIDMFVKLRNVFGPLMR